MRKNLSENLVDDYEAAQLNPICKESEEGEASHKEITEQIEKLPEVTNMRLRIATFEAIIDEVIEDAVSAEEETPREADINEIVEPIVEKAVAMYIVPHTIRNRIPHLIASHLRTQDARKRLLAKTAHFVMEAETEVPEKIAEEISVPMIEEALDTKDQAFVEHDNEPLPAQEGISVRSMFNRYMAGEITKEELDAAVEASGAITGDAVKPEDEVEREETPVVKVDDVEVSEGLPTEQAAALRYLAASSLNHRSATVAVSQKLTGPMLSNMMHKLRYVLPENFVKKFRVK